ncbi:hypothetical protein STCU_11053 [Strigomonas culicis]|uniref:EF-hand domain-containing protein n=1 Tax=Strigomonas culicis TaxID=28005 RepID=S9V1M7_9TRYP|nr:hypothetical protein STCU_11053 [Strigomonas culicis]|eukprot:EPY16695.1 hypothetical protein STCU_11053 [Strigomonas culicis]
MTASSSDFDFERVEDLRKQFYVMPHQLQEAKQLFDHYCSLDTPTSTSPGNDEAVNENAAVSPREREMSVKALAMLFKDLGVDKSPAEVRELVDQRTRHSALLDQPRVAQGEALTVPVVAEDPMRRSKSGRSSSRSLSPRRKRLGTADDNKDKEEGTRLGPAAEGSGKYTEERRSPAPQRAPGIAFEQFVYLLLSSFEEEEETSTRTEIETTFKKLDMDGNGELSEQDIRQAVERYQKEVHNGSPQTYSADSTDVMQLVANMHSAEMQLALGECDLNGDGVITMADFALCLLRSY